MAVRRQEETGFTLIEVMVAFAVLMVVITPLAYMLLAQVNSSVMSKQQLTAIGRAEHLVETLSNSTPPASSLGGPNVGVVTHPNPARELLAGTTYSYDTEYSWSGVGTPDLCKAGIPQVLDLQVWVYWDGTRHSVTDNTLINYPSHGVQTLGFIAVQLSNSATANVNPIDDHGNPYSTRVQSVPVTIDGTANTPPVAAITLYPDSNGCVFTEATPGTYTVSVANPTSGKPTGMSYGSPYFVANLTNQPTPPSSTTTTVSIGQTSNVTYEYDEATPVSVNYAVGVTTVASPTHVPLTIYNQALVPSSYWNVVPFATTPAVTALPTSSGGGIFPFFDGYSIFAGDCGAESTPNGIALITTAPGVETSVTVPLASVTIVVSVLNVAGISVTVPLASVNLVTSWPNNPECPVDTYPFATTDSSGSTTGVVPFGSYNINVTATVGTPLSATVPISVTSTTGVSSFSFSVVLP
jgi:type II secretory pathway pseudopilin PulG